MSAGPEFGAMCACSSTYGGDEGHTAAAVVKGTPPPRNTHTPDRQGGSRAKRSSSSSKRKRQVPTGANPLALPSWATSRLITPHLAHIDRSTKIDLEADTFPNALTQVHSRSRTYQLQFSSIFLCSFVTAWRLGWAPSRTPVGFDRWSKHRRTSSGGQWSTHWP